MLKKIIVIFIFLVAVSTAFSKEKESFDSKLPITYVVPGIEQIKRGYYLKGIILFSSFSSCIGEAIINNNKGNDYYEKYLNSKIVDEIVLLREKTEQSFRRRNYFLIGAFSIWIFNLIDLQFFSREKGVKGELSKNGFSISFYYTF